MSQRSNIKLRTSVILGMIGFSILFAAAIFMIFRRSSKMDSEHVEIVSLNGEIENQVLRSRIIIDDIIIYKDIEMLPELISWSDSIKFNMSGMMTLIEQRYAENRNIDLGPFYDMYISVSDKLRQIQNSLQGIEAYNQEMVREIHDDYTSFMLDFKELQSSIPNYLLIDYLRYKREILGLITISFILIFLGGFLSIRLINKLIGADRILINNAIDVENRERERIAADLHDSLGSLLSGLMIYIRVLEKEVDDNSMLMDKVKQLNKIATAALNSIEEVINNLRPALLSRHGLIKSLERITEKVNELGKTRFSINAEAFNLRLPESTELLVYRICSELITNALKHAGAEKVDFIFMNHRNKVTLVYSDDGIGFDPGSLSYEMNKSGLYNIIRRVESLEGKYEIKSKPGAGVEIRIYFKSEPKNT